MSPSPPDVAATILELRPATKTYAGVPAIDGVDFALRTGEIHAIVGENGAGKSTLTKVMAGVVNLTSGQMLVEGREVNPRTPNEALHLGVAPDERLLVTDGSLEHPVAHWRHDL
ncbi:MAG: ATP-binding cassette domain-containing protein, partial [Caldimonas sp.]